MTRAIVIGLPLVAACFDPTFHDPTCGPAGECPDELSCVSGVCRLAAEPDARGGDASLIDAGPIDAELPDADPTAPDAADPCDAWTYAPANVPCTGPTGSWNVTVSTTINTDTGAVTAGAAPTSAVVTQTGSTQMARVVVVDAFSIGTGITLDVVGSLPLIVQVHGDATINGVLDISAHYEVPGAGGSVSLCAGGNGAAGQSSTSGGCGGGGGGFGGGGGLGGDGNGGNGGNGGTALTGTATSLSPLRGGCPGGKGGDDSPGTGGNGGAGGGALQVSVSGAISIAGTIQAGGGGGRGGQEDGGGGGGGSGGAILFEAPSITTALAAKVCANSGAGGEGSTSTGGTDGENAVCMTAAQGGAGATSEGGDGGDGTYGSTATGAAGGDHAPLLSAGGGGGGGGRGIIRIRGALSSAGLITPTPINVAL